MLNERLLQLNDYPFQRLADLLAGQGPRANVPPIDLSVGEPKHAPPPFVAEIIHAHAHSWNRYPPLKGTPEFLRAAAGWLGRRYRLGAGAIDPETQIAPVAGTREGLFMAAGLAIGSANGALPPVALMPNPFYQVYYGAAVMAGAEPVLLPAGPETGFLPDLAAIPAATLARTRIMYLCSPANPQGAVADLAYLRAAHALARTHDFLLVTDECYAEIYAPDRPPPGMLEAAEGGLDHLLIFHSLSKRSSVPGFRSGFAVGAPDTIAAFNRLRSYSCAGTPLPVMAAATALWEDDAHAVQNRALYQAKFDLADRLLGGRFGYQRPPGGFFLWLDVGDGEAAARRLWTEAALRTLPGAYLTRAEADGRNSGQAYLRLALVHDGETTEAALGRLVQVL